MNKGQVRQMTNAAGKPVANHFTIETSEGVYLQSYKSIIVFMPFEGGTTLLDAKYWDYSTTTGKYRNMFLNETIDETRRKIDAGIYQLANLN